MLYSSVCFVKCMMLYIHDYSIIRIVSLQKYFLCFTYLFIPSFLSSITGDHIFFTAFIIFFFYFSRISHSWNHIECSFSDKHLSFSNMHLWGPPCLSLFIYIFFFMAWVAHFSFLLLNNILLYWIDTDCHRLFTHSTIEGHLGCFQVLVILNKAAINFCVQVFLCGHSFWILLGKGLGAWLLDLC